MTNEILTGKICPYCGQPSELIDSIRVYKSNSYGLIYICFRCDAYVGCHKGTDKSLGRLANSELRKYKKQAHLYFDYLWKKKMKVTKCSKFEARTTAYKWLSEKMNIPLDFCHIGMFTVNQCKSVIELCKPYYGN